MATHDDDPLVSVTALIRQSQLSAYYTNLGSMHAAPEATLTPAAPVPEARVDGGEGVSLDALRVAGPGLTEEVVRRSYAGGDSEYWRPFLKLLAHTPEEWVHWPKIYNALGLKNTEAAGMLGAAERRCKGLPPYVKTKEDGQYYFWMPKDVSDLIIELATT